MGNLKLTIAIEKINNTLLEIAYLLPFEYSFVDLVTGESTDSDGEGLVVDL